MSRPEDMKMAVDAESLSPVFLEIFSGPSVIFLAAVVLWWAIIRCILDFSG